MKGTKNIKQTVVLPATPKEVYNALLDSKKHSEFTGEKAKASKKVGDTFTAYSGYITGVNVELQPSAKIVQAWRASEWPEDHYSICTFKFSKAGAEGTRLEFTQIGVPAEFAKSIEKGWWDYYWNPMQTMFEEG